MQKTPLNQDASLLFALERERARIASTLRAETVQVLTSVLVGLTAVERLGDVQAIRAYLGELRQTVRDELAQIQHRASEIWPSVLDDFGLAAAVRAAVASFQAAGSAAVAIEWPESPQQLTPDQALLLFRIVQEALRNAIRHANAQQISVRMSREHWRLLVEVHDDGCGFDAGQSNEQPPERYGIRLMRTQARLLGGTLEVDSHPGSGTTVRMRLPLEGE